MIPYGPILVVEDVPNILELLEVTLRFKGYPVVTASNGQEALARVAEQIPALVITDILMPRLDGYSLVQRLRTDPATSRIPIIFLSATYVTPEDKAFALSLGAMRFLEKPVDTEEFLLTVAEVLTETARVSAPLRESDFARGYRQRLENKLRHKSIQVARIERLLPTLPPEMQTSFELLLEEAHTQQREILAELESLRQGNGDAEDEAAA